MVEIHHATPGAVRRTIIHVAIATVAGVTLLSLSQRYQPLLLDWAASDPAKMRSRAQMLIAVLGAITLTPLIGFAVYVWHLGTRTLREERFPPEGLVVIKDVLVVRGAEARSRGRLFRLFGVTFFLIAGLLALILVRLATLSQP